MKIFVVTVADMSIVIELGKRGIMEAIERIIKQLRKQQNEHIRKKPKKRKGFEDLIQRRLPNRYYIPVIDVTTQSTLGYYEIPLHSKNKRRKENVNC